MTLRQLINELRDLEYYGFGEEQVVWMNLKTEEWVPVESIEADGEVQLR